MNNAAELLTELPFGLPGRVFRSPMPFSIYDARGEIANCYQQEDVSVVVLLAQDGECLRRSGRPLRAFYASQGLEVIYLPIPDFGVPSREALEQAVGAALERLLSGQNLAIHCHAGIGRSGMFAACLARRVFGFSGEEAIGWVRQYVAGAVESLEQRELVLNCGKDRTI